MSQESAMPSVRWRVAFFSVPILVAVFLPRFFEDMSRVSRVLLGVVAGLVAFAVLFGVQQRFGGRPPGDPGTS